MKIAFFTDTYFPQINGVSFVVRNHAKKLIERGNKVEIFAPPNKEKDVKVNCLDAIKFLFYPGYYIVVPSLKNLKILKEISKKNFDVIHCHTPFFAGIMGIILAKILRKKHKNVLLVGTYHTILSEFVYILPFPKKITKKLADYYSIKFYNYMDLVITPSEYTKKFLKYKGLKKPVFVISNGIDLNLFKSNNDNNELKKIKEKFNTNHLILHVGRISKERNIDKIIYAAKNIVKKFPDAKFLIIGDGIEIENLKNIVKNLNLQNNVIFTGKIEQKYLPLYYRAADVFVTASTIDTQGLVVLESLACGTPVVAANSRALPEIVKNNENGFLFHYKNVEELSEKVIKILENKKLREKFSENGIKIAEKHDINKSVDMLTEIYKKF